MPAPLLLLALLALQHASAFYLPGVAPKEFKDGDTVRRCSALPRLRHRVADCSAVRWLAG
jgi:hypothetical protein